MTEVLKNQMILLSKNHFRLLYQTKSNKTNPHIPFAIIFALPIQRLPDEMCFDNIDNDLNSWLIVLMLLVQNLVLRSVTMRD